MNIYDVSVGAELRERIELWQAGRFAETIDREWLQQRREARAAPASPVHRGESGGGMAPGTRQRTPRHAHRARRSYNMGYLLLICQTKCVL